MAEWLARAADLVWSYPVVGLCLLSALYFTLRLGFVQLRCFPHALALISGRYDREDEAGNISHLQALAAALSGTIGIGNIAGVAIAISVGGPGAVLWMWITGLLGMATKFVECTLGTHYREIDAITGEARGGPMYYILAGLGPRWRPVALFYALTIALAGFGFTCMFQSNQAADALKTHFLVPSWATGAALTVLTGAVILGGIESIGRWAARIVPAMCLIYVGGALVICVLEFEQLPAVLGLIVRDGLSGKAAAGGALGSVILWGVRRAIFSNEAGLGSASIAHAAVKTDEPVREGVVASLGPFIDTVVVSGATAFVIILAGNYGAGAPEGLSGISLSADAFDQFLPGFGSIFITLAGFGFALSTMITWSYYGEVASVWVLGPRAALVYRIVFVALAFVGAVRKLDVVISFSDLFVGLLVVPNVIALVWLSPKVVGWSRDYFLRLRSGAFDEPG
ncbi:probable sodium/alanine symporter [Plesiocystis pacifica SIR-1]|uniref:Probable sodium/alanine symporter n=1 Tax=Plesiocystis pacifica SIR-1 TaxID=391625 RepID=A6G892_9BACT|nr:sodium:alanine symporter family protein [Plesiocystis pacifica]EDM77933.1 probable sodium/alanine symporter [Plesiocystis pacifica SIR-1]